MAWLPWILQIAGLCVVPLALMGGLAQGEHAPEALPTLELRLLALGAGLFLLGRFLARKDP